MNPGIEQVTARIRARSADSRGRYLAQIEHWAARAPGSQRMGCANVAHAFAGMPADARFKVVTERVPNIGVVTAYNDMLSAHRPYEIYPAALRAEAARHGATLQVAGGVPAMCDGVTQGEPGMELSLFSRDTIAMATAVALSHDVFDGALLLGVCDKIVPGLLIGALHFGHLPCVFVPAGPMASGLSNSEKAKVREKAAQGLVGRDELMAAEQAAYHDVGTCTFYGTANSNQMLLESMGLHVPGAAFVPPVGALREALTLAAVPTLLGITPRARYTPIGRVVDERCIVNALVALLATGGSTNHLIHWVAVARAAGILIDWTDCAELSALVPLLARVYPNGTADVNAFHAAGGTAYVLRELQGAGLAYADVQTVADAALADGLAAYGLVPRLRTAAAEANGQGLTSTLDWQPVPADSGDESVLRPAAAPFSATGGLKLLTGNLGRAVIKVSAVPEDRHIVEAPARIFHSQEAMQRAFKAGELARDVVVVVRFQGPQANGMPELHKLTPPLAVLQGQGFRVALVTDGRMSGASGKVPAAIHVSPEALAGGPLAKLRDGDLVRMDAVAGTLQALVAEADWDARPLVSRDEADAEAYGHGIGRELFGGMRRHVRSAEEGAITWA